MKIFCKLLKENLREETGIKSTELIKELPGWLEYYLPKNLLGKVLEGKYSGQKQKWFIMKFVGKNEEINIKTKKPEFLEWKWINSSELPNVVVDFKVKIYKDIEKILKSFKLI